MYSYFMSVLECFLHMILDFWVLQTYYLDISYVIILARLYHKALWFASLHIFLFVFVFLRVGLTYQGWFGVGVIMTSDSGSCQICIRVLGSLVSCVKDQNV